MLSGSSAHRSLRVLNVGYILLQTLCSVGCGLTSCVKFFLQSPISSLAAVVYYQPLIRHASSANIAWDFLPLALSTPHWHFFPWV